MNLTGSQGRRSGAGTARALPAEEARALLTEGARALLAEDQPRRGQPVLAVQQPDADVIVRVAGDHVGLLAGHYRAVVLHPGGRWRTGGPGEDVLDDGPVDGVVHMTRRIDVRSPQRPGPAGPGPRRRRM